MWFYASLFLCFVNAIASLGVVGYLLALIRSPETVKHQYFVYSTDSPNGLSPMSVLPGLVLERSLWLSIATCAFAVIDVPAMASLWRRVHAETTDNMVGRQRLTALSLVSAINLIMGNITVLYGFRDEHRYVDLDSPHGWLFINAPTSGPYHQYISSVGFTIETFSCGLVEVALNPQDRFASHLCRVAGVPFWLLVFHTFMSLVTMYRVSKVIERVQEAEKAKNESGGITCSEIER